MAVVPGLCGDMAYQFRIRFCFASGWTEWGPATEPCRTEKQGQSQSVSQLMAFNANARDRILNIVKAMQKNDGDNFVQQVGCCSLAQLCFDEETAEIIVEEKALELVAKAMAKYKLDKVIAQSGSYVLGRISMHSHLHTFVLELRDEKKDPNADALLTAVMDQFPVHHWQAVHFAAQWAQIRLRKPQKPRPKALPRKTPFLTKIQSRVLISTQPDPSQEREPMGMNAAASHIQALYRAKKSYQNLQGVLLSITEKFWSPEEKKFYYYNTKTGDTSYEIPRYLSETMVTQKYDLRRQEVELFTMVDEDRNILKIKIPKKKKGYGGY